MVQIHRFHDKVSLYTGQPGDVYLTAAEAIRLGNMLVKYGRDVKTKDFQESDLGTFTTTFKNEKIVF